MNYYSRTSVRALPTITSSDLLLLWQLASILIYIPTSCPGSHPDHLANSPKPSRGSGSGNRSAPRSTRGVRPFSIAEVIGTTGWLILAGRHGIWQRSFGPSSSS